MKKVKTIDSTVRKRKKMIIFEIKSMRAFFKKL